MIAFKDQWNLEMTLEVLKNKTVDNKTWSDAAKWLTLYGPPDLQKIMQKASSIATNSSFPKLAPERYTEAGAPCYNVEKVAEVLGVTRQDALEKMAEMEYDQGIQHFLDESESYNIQ
jgi:hypothetical protein